MEVSTSQEAPSAQTVGFVQGTSVPRRQPVHGGPHSLVLCCTPWGCGQGRGPATVLWGGLAVPRAVEKGKHRPPPGGP